MKYEVNKDEAIHLSLNNKETPNNPHGEKIGNLTGKVKKAKIVKKPQDNDYPTSCFIKIMF